MPGNTSKRPCIESTRKREGRENDEAIQHERAEKKASAKARKDCRDEAAEDDPFVEHDGESASLTKLRVLTLKLESDNQRMHAKLARREAKDEAAQSQSIIPMPENKGDINVEHIRRHLDLVGEEHDVEWCIIRAENRCPELKHFENHWAVEFVLKESFNNHFNYQHKQTSQLGTPSSSTRCRVSTPSSRSTSTRLQLNRLHINTNNTAPSSPSSHSTSACPCPKNLLSSTDTDADADTETYNNAHQAKLHKAAAYQAAEHKTAKRKANSDNSDGVSDSEAILPLNDGDTELEDIPDELWKVIEEEEIGVPATPRPPVKTTTKRSGLILVIKPPAQPQHASTPRPVLGKKLVSLLLCPTDIPQDTKPKPRPIIYMKRGQGGMVGRGGSRGGGVSMVSCERLDTGGGDGNVISTSSGQTTSADEES